MKYILLIFLVTSLIIGTHYYGKARGAVNSASPLEEPLEIQNVVKDPVPSFVIPDAYPHGGTATTATATERHGYRIGTIQTLTDYIERQNIIDRLNKGQVTDSEREFIGKVFSRLTQLRSEEIQDGLRELKLEMDRLQARRSP